MFSLLFKRFSQKNTVTLNLPTNINNFYLLQTQKPHCFCSISQNQLSPTVSYLTDKCGVPLDSAIKVSQKIQIVSTEKPNSVLQLLRKYEFTQPQIINLIVKFPSLLLADPVKTLQPKFEFFESLGLSKPETGKLVSSYKLILCRSLANQIMPTYDFLKRYINNDKDVVTALIQVQCEFVGTKKFRLAAESNIEVLKNHGVPHLNIGKLLMRQPKVLSLESDQFKEIVESVEGLGFNPHGLIFVDAIGTMGVTGKSGWENRKEAYKRFGWTEEDAISAFRLQPRCMLVSEKKIEKMMNFYLNELGLTTYDINKHPNLMMVGLENRVIPRCSVLQVLVLNGLIRKGVNLMTTLNMSKKQFEKRYVNKYKEAAPETLKAYKGELGYPKLEVFSSVQ